MRSRPRTAAVALLLLTFVVGGLAGMALEEAAGLDWFDFLDEDSQPASANLLSGLNLTPTQEARIEAILDTQDDDLEAYWRSRVPEMRAVVAASYQEIRAILSPEQQASFDERVRAQGIPMPRALD